MSLPVRTLHACVLALRSFKREVGTFLNRDGGRNESPDYRHLRHALSCRLMEIGDAYERADIESARRALHMATAIDAELSFGTVLNTTGLDLAHPASGEAP